MSDGEPLSLGFLQFMESAPDAMVCVDSKGAIVLVNAQAEALFGHSRTDLLGKTIEKLIPSRYHPQHVGHREGYMADPHVRPMGAGRELKAQHKDGHEFPVEISLSPITTPEGTIVAASIRDISDRVSAERRFRALLDSAPDAMLIVDDQGDMVLVNAQAEATFGYPREELLNQKIEMLIPERYRGTHEGHRGGFFASPRARSMGSGLELFARRKDGSEFPVEISLSPIETEGERLVAAAVRDVSERKAAESEARQAQERERELAHLQQLDEFRTRFINAASHELFTPLTPISATLTVLERHGDNASKREKALEILRRSFGRLSGLVSDLLEASRFQSGTLALHPEPIDAARILRGVIEDFRATAEAKEVTLDIEAPDGLDCTADPKRINQVLYNLVSNALKFTPPGGTIRAVGLARDGNLELSVTDSGVGLTADQIDKLFEPFVRLHEDSAPGTGLGLYICKGLVEAHGGTLQATSPGTGEGATFTLVLPCGGPA